MADRPLIKSRAL